MIDLPVELFTTQTAVDVRLIESLKRGEVKITGSYELTSERFLQYQQKLKNYYIGKQDILNKKGRPNGAPNNKKKILSLVIYFF